MIKQQGQGSSLIECMISMALSLLLIECMLQTYLHTKDLYLRQQGLARIQENGLLAVQLLRQEMQSDPVTTFFIRNTGRKNNVGMPIYGLYMKKKRQVEELIPGVESLEIKYQNDGAHIKLVINSIDRVSADFDGLLKKTWEFTVLLNHG